MFNQNKFDGLTGDGILSPTLNKYNLPNAMFHHTRSNSSMTPTRPIFRRYSLADNKLSPKTKSLPYCTHISTRIDGKSPGYSSRVVQYNAEQEKSLPVNHRKYDKLGVFPIVHIFKKDLPHLKRKLSDVSDRMNSLELSRYNSPEHHKMLLEKIIKSSPVTDNILPKKDVNTKSVLDALKEISRKRIHSNEEEYVLKDDGKRMHVTYDVESTSRKRVRHNVLDGDNSVVSTCSSHKPPSIDEVMASESSTNGYVCNISIQPRTESFTNSPAKPVSPVKYVDVETQTTTSQVNSTTELTPVVEKIEKEPENQIIEKEPTKTKRTSPVKVFDETPLETMRRNRLTALMGSLSQHKTQDKDISTKKEKTMFDKPLVSILAGNTKSPNKSNKHVTFDLPESSSDLGTVSGSEISDTQGTVGGLSITKTSAAIIAPIVSASITESAPMNKTLDQTASVPLPKNSEQMQQNFTSTITFSPQNQTVTIPSQKTVINSFTENKENVEQDRQTLKPIVTNVSNQPSTSVSNKEPNQQAGFKFDLTTTASVTFAPFSFKSTLSTASNSLVSNASSFSHVSSLATNSKQTLPTFGLAPTQLNFSSENSSVAFNNSTGVSSSTFTPPKIQLSSTNATLSSNFLSVPLVGTSASTISTSSNSTPLFKTNGVIPNVTSSTSTTTSSLFNFASNNTVTQSALSSTLPSTVSFNFTPSSFNASTTSTTFPSLSSTASFGVNPNNPFINSTPSTLNKAVNFETATPSVPNFSASNNKTVGNSNFPFGSNLSFNNPNPSIFNNVNNSGNFGGESATKSSFGQSANPTFGTATTTVSLTTNSTTVFGNAGSNIFSNTSGFGTSTTSSFGSSSTISFGNNNFSSNQNPPFGNLKNTTSFGTPTNTAFGISTTTPAFPTNTASFSAASGNTFHQPAPNTFSSNFGTVSSPFDKPSTTSEVPAFRSSAPAFGNNNFPVNLPSSQNNVFNFANNDATSKPPIFSFGTSEPPKPTFNFTKENHPSVFGMNNKQPFSTSPPAFNSVSNPFNVQPAGAMFNIGTGGSSTPSRSRGPQKTKRRT